MSVQSGHISLDGVGKRIHSCVSNLFCRKSGNQIRIHDGNVRCDVEVSQRIFYAGLIIGDNGESGHFRSGSGCTRDSGKFGFLSQFREVKRNAEIFKGGVRIFIECPHSLRSVDRGTAAHGNDPVRLKLAHCLCAAHDGLNGWVRLNALKYFHFYTGFFQVADSLIQEALTFHGTAAHDEHGFLSFQVL